MGTRFVEAGHCVSCLSLTNIAVDVQHRRQGHARSSLTALRHAAAEHSCVLIVENVVSKHMHSLINDLDGVSLPGSRAGAHGCHYWLPPSRNFVWQDTILVSWMLSVHM